MDGVLSNWKVATERHEIADLWNISRQTDRAPALASCSDLEGADRSQCAQSALEEIPGAISVALLIKQDHKRGGGEVAGAAGLRLDEIQRALRQKPGRGKPKLLGLDRRSHGLVVRHALDLPLAEGPGLRRRRQGVEAAQVTAAPIGEAAEGGGQVRAWLCRRSPQHRFRQGQARLGPIRRGQRQGLRQMEVPPRC